MDYGEPFDTQRLIVASEANRYQSFLCLARTPGGQQYDGTDVKWVDSGTPVLNLVFGARFDGGEPGRQIDSVLQHFRARSVAIFWMVGPGTRPADLGERLEARGFTLESQLAHMAFDLSDFIRRTPGVPEVEVSIARGPELKTWCETACRGFDVRGPFREQFARVAHDGFNGHGLYDAYLATEKGRPVATAALMPAFGVGGIYWVSTVPEARGRGIARMLLETVVADAREKGCRMAVLQSTEMGYGFYKRLGFRDSIGIERSYEWRPW